MMSALVSDPNPPAKEMLIFKNDFRLLNGSPIRIFMQNSTYLVSKGMIAQYTQFFCGAKKGYKKGAKKLSRRVE